MTQLTNFNSLDEYQTLAQELPLTDQKTLLINQIKTLQQELEKSLIVKQLTIFETTAEPETLAVSYAGNYFTQIAKTQLIAVIIGSLLLMIASRVLYET